MTAYLFDVETTDRKAPLQIIEAAWIRMRPGVDVVGGDEDFICLYLDSEFFCERFQPSVLITFGSMAVHHILPKELEGCRPSSQFKLPEDCTYLVGHSIDFDWEAAGSPPQIKRICTHAMAQHVYPEATGYSQSALIYMLLGATESTRALVQGAHGAGRDVHMNAMLLMRILEDMPTRVTRWSDLWEFSEECRIPRTCPMKRYEGVPLQDLDAGFVDWCLAQPWLDPYFRKGLMRVIGR